MDYRRSVERHLRNYRFIKISIENMRLRMETELNPKGLSAIRYDRDIVQSNSTESAVENEAVYLASIKEALEADIKRNEAMLRIMERCINALSPTHRKVIELRYMGERLSWSEIASKMDYSCTHCKRLHSGAVFQISIGMYGIEATQQSKRKEGGA